ncbi:TRAP transporter small permease subunit [Desulfoscipio sp. XC116]|uniref:TRAP transporter small permease subunit n=1 Tax=Desulfoscipio sp. XC116 TaxID=3144975 RepID=UPI00325B7DBC
MNLFAKMISEINHCAMWICGALILFMGFLITVDVILRSTINYSVQWAFALNCYISSTVALLAGGYALLEKQHVRVDIFYNKFSPRIRGIVDLCTSSLTYLLCGVFMWTGGVLCIESFTAGSMTGGVINIPSYIPQMLIPLGGLLLGLQALTASHNDIKLALGIETVDKEGSS